MVYTQETKHLESLDEILRNLKKDAEFYNHGMTQDEYMELEQRD